MKTPLTSKSLKHHLAYSWWKYLLIALLAFGLVDLLYSVTTYRPPRDKTLGFFVYGHMDEQGLNEWMENIRETEMPDLEEMRAQLLIEDDTYGGLKPFRCFLGSKYLEGYSDHLPLVITLTTK